MADYLNDDDLQIMEYLTDIHFVESSNPTISLVCFNNVFEDS